MQGVTVRSASDQEGNRSVHAIRQRIRGEIQSAWHDLWDHRIEDKRTAEDLARKDYELLFVERGTVIKATKDYAPPDLHEIVDRNEKLLGIPLRFPDPQTGGWRKFAQTTLSKQRRWHRHPSRDAATPAARKRNGPPKQGGRGWLHR